MVYRMVIFCRGRSVRSPCSVSVPMNSCVLGVRRRSDRTFAIGRDYRSLISYYILPRLRRFCLFTLYHDVVRRHGVEHGPARPRTRSLPDHALAHALLPAPGPSTVRYEVSSSSTSSVVAFHVSRLPACVITSNVASKILQPDTYQIPTLASRFTRFAHGARGWAAACCEV